MVQGLAVARPFNGRRTVCRFLSLAFSYAFSIFDDRFRKTVNAGMSKNYDIIFSKSYHNLPKKGNFLGDSFV